MATKSWQEIKAKRPLSDADRRVVDEHKRLIELDVRLHELRARRGVSQATLASELDVSQANISRIENEADLRWSTLERYVRALGGELEVIARFPDEDVVIATPRPRTQ
jgi:transcriptional regulator with XRE-family HTH domain